MTVVDVVAVEDVVVVVEVVMTDGVEMTDVIMVEETTGLGLPGDLTGAMIGTTMTRIIKVECTYCDVDIDNIHCFRHCLSHSWSQLKTYLGTVSP